MELTERDILRIAAEADVDPRTVRRYLGGEGKPRSRAVQVAIDAALTKVRDAAAKGTEGGEA